MYYFFKNLWISIVSLKNFIPKTAADSKVCMIGHRGYSSKHIDNTEPAFLAAAKHGSGGIETDVHMTSDNKLILCHNSDAEYEDGTKLIIADSTFDELLKKPLKNKYSDEKVYLCTLRRYLEISRDNKLVCFIEFKGEFTDEMTKEAFELAKEVYDINMCILQSFNMNNLIRARELFPELPIMLTYGRNQRDEHFNLNECIKRGFNLDADYSTISRKTVKLFHDNGLTVGVWTCNDKRTLNYAHSLGVDYIESDVFGGIGVD